MGNVILKHVNVIPAVSHKLHRTPEQFTEFYKKYVDDMMIGCLSAKEFWHSYSIYFGQHITEDYLETCFDPVEDREMVQLLENLRAEGNRVVCGTNTYESHYSKMQSCGILNHFDRIYASHLMRIAKPDKKFYQHIIDTEGFSPDEVFFTDDLQENIDSAHQLGIHAVRFLGFVSLIESL